MLNFQESEPLEISGDEKITIVDTGYIRDEENCWSNNNLEVGPNTEINNNNLVLPPPPTTETDIETPEYYTIELPNGYRKYHARSTTRLIRDVSYYLDLNETTTSSYDADSEDQELARSLNISLENFEKVMEKFASTKLRVFSKKVSKLCSSLEIPDDKLEVLFDYWRSKPKPPIPNSKLPKKFIAFRQRPQKTPRKFTRGTKQLEVQTKLELYQEAVRKQERLKWTAEMLKHNLECRKKELDLSQRSLKIFGEKYKGKFRFWIF